MSEQKLWAPWRAEYLKTIEESGADCFLCEAANAPDDQALRDRRLILRHDAHGILMLNRFPYANGHLLIAPHRHVAQIEDLEASERAALMELATLGTRLLKLAHNAQGTNVGLNLGRCAGAGVPGHLHLHVVPRWHGDVSFMDVVGAVRIIPEALETSFNQLKAVLAQLDAEQ